MWKRSSTYKTRSYTHHISCISWSSVWAFFFLKKDPQLVPDFAESRISLPFLFFVCWPVYFFDLVVCCGAGFFQSFLPHECLLTSRLPPWFSSLLPWLQRYVAPVPPSYLHSHCQASPSILALCCKSSSAVCQFVVWSTDSSIHFFVRYCGGFSLWTFLCLDPVLERFYPHLKKKKTFWLCRPIIDESRKKKNSVKNKTCHWNIAELHKKCEREQTIFHSPSSTKFVATQTICWNILMTCFVSCFP